VALIPQVNLSLNFGVLASNVSCLKHNLSSIYIDE